MFSSNIIKINKKYDWEVCLVLNILFYVIDALICKSLVSIIIDNLVNLMLNIIITYKKLNLYHYIYKYNGHRPELSKL